MLINHMRVSARSAAAKSILREALIDSEIDSSDRRAANSSGIPVHRPLIKQRPTPSNSPNARPGLRGYCRKQAAENRN